MINQLAKFAGALAEQSAPIRNLLLKDRVWSWDVAHQMAFDRIKRTSVSAPVLALYDPVKPTFVSADNTSYGLGAVLQQQQPNGKWPPVFYASRSLTDVDRATLGTDRKGVLGADVSV
jgi:hypothetical protein